MIGTIILDKVHEVFRSKKIMTLFDLSNALSCSTRTVQRRLRQWQTYTSYNENGRYFVLPEIAEFNRHGIFEYKKILFSKHGGLLDTVVHAVETSSAGLNALELGEIIQLPAYSFLSHFSDDKRLKKIKFKGLFVYFSSQDIIFNKQQKERETRISSLAKLDLPTNTEAVIILVEAIKHPNETLEQLTRRVQKQIKGLSIERIRNLFTYHGILKKKNHL